MTQRVATLSFLFSGRRADTATIDTSLSLRWQGEGDRLHEIFSSCLHRPIRSVIVGPLWGSICILYRNKMVVVLRFRIPTFVARNFCRSRRVKMRPIPSCPPLFREWGDIVGNASIHSPRSEPLPVGHHRQCWFFIHHRRQNFSGSEHGRSLFNFCPTSQYCMGTSSYWPKTPGRRNRLTLLVSLPMA